MKRRFGAMPPRKVMMIAVCVLLWAVALIVLLCFLIREKNTGTTPVYGSLEGRFLSDISMELDGRTLYYRENEITNYLIIGVDKEDAAQTAGHQSGGQADFLVMLCIDRVNRTITPLMLDRDTMTEIQTYGVFGHPAGTRVMQLCLAQAYSGTSAPGSVNTSDAVRKLLHGVKVDRYLALDMTAISLVNDAIGGVEVTLQDDMTVFDPMMAEGATVRLMGGQAEFFVRGRMTVADGTNASRMARQQQYLSGFIAQFRRYAGEDDSAIGDILKILDGHMESDAAEEILLRDASVYDHYEWQPMLTLEGEHSIDEYGFAQFHADEDALKRLVAGIWFE